jgi:hypothetical protein
VERFQGVARLGAASAGLASSGRLS